MGINAKVIVSMMMDAGMSEDAIIAALKSFKPIATFGGAQYFDAVADSRYIKRHAA